MMVKLLAFSLFNNLNLINDGTNIYTGILAIY